MLIRWWGLMIHICVTFSAIILLLQIITFLIMYNIFKGGDLKDYRPRANATLRRLFCVWNHHHHQHDQSMTKYTRISSFLSPKRKYNTMQCNNAPSNYKILHYYHHLDWLIKCYCRLPMREYISRYRGNNSGVGGGVCGMAVVSWF